MKYKVFDVVELIDGNKATILSRNNSIYKAEIVNNNGDRQEIKEIEENDIKRLIISHRNIL